MSQQNIFTKIMNWIEKETDMPLLQKDIADWLENDKDNKAIYRIYKFASNSRDI